MYGAKGADKGSYKEKHPMGSSHWCWTLLLHVCISFALSPPCGAHWASHWALFATTASASQSHGYNLQQGLPRRFRKQAMHTLKPSTIPKWLDTRPYKDCRGGHRSNFYSNWGLTRGSLLLPAAPQVLSWRMLSSACCKPLVLAAASQGLTRLPPAMCHTTCC